MNNNFIKNETMQKVSKNGIELLIPKIDNDNVTIIFVNVNGEKANYCILDKSTMFYYIIEGIGEFEIDNDFIKVKRGDLIEIKPHQKYSYKGNMKMIEIQNNKFDASEVHEITKFFE